jgi:hypothetical protein
LLASGKVDWEQVAKSAAVAGAGAGISQAIGGAEAVGGTDYSLTGGGANVGGTPGVSEVFPVAPPTPITVTPLPPQAAGLGSLAASVGGTPGVSEVFPVAPPAPIQVAPLPPQAAGAGLGALADSTPADLGTIEIRAPRLEPTIPGEALALGAGAVLAPVLAPGTSGAPIIDKSFPAPETPETFEPSSIIDTAGEVLGGLTGAEIAGGLLVGVALMSGAAEPELEIPAEPAPRVYDPRGFDVRLSNVAPIDVAGTPVSTINFSGATPVEAGGLAAPRGIGSLINIPTYAPTLT